jgi:hypothetical protein
MKTEIVEGVLLVVHGHEPPTDDEWEAYLGQVKLVVATGRPRAMAVTEGGAPSLSQRTQLNRILRGTRALGAVVSDSSFVRGIVTALSWFNRGVRSFSPADFEVACAHLELSDAQVHQLRGRLDALRESLGLTPFASSVRGRIVSRDQPRP